MMSNLEGSRYTIKKSEFFKGIIIVVELDCKKALT